MTWLFGGPVQEVGIPYLNRLRAASYVQIQSIFDWRLVAVLAVVAGFFYATTAISVVTGIELYKRVLAGRLRVRAWLRRSIRYRESQRSLIRLQLHG
jgi:hypothetical protein